MASRSPCTPVRKMGEEEMRRKGGRRLLAGSRRVSFGDFLVLRFGLVGRGWFRVVGGLFRRGCGWELEEFLFLCSFEGITCGDSLIVSYATSRTFSDCAIHNFTDMCRSWIKNNFQVNDHRDSSIEECRVFSLLLSFS